MGNTTYTVKVHFSKSTDKTFKDRVQNLIINECPEKNQK
ncbi:MAG: transposon-encoded TnpW family protein [Lachnospiraceae bacterium]|nr:transposon-encoded TnpW family protein [Lachnospiraceae bacterium]